MNREIEKKIKKYTQKKFASPKAKSEHCQYKSSGKRYCKCTTQTSCDNCKFFDALTESKFIALIEIIDDLEAELHYYNSVLNRNRFR